MFKRKIKNLFDYIKYNKLYKYIKELFFNICSFRKVFYILIFAFFIFFIRILVKNSISYFITRIDYTNKTMSVIAKNINIVFNDVDGNIYASNINNTWSSTKSFTIKNNSDNTYTYNLVIKNFKNTFTDNSIEYQLICTSSSSNCGSFVNMAEYSGLSNFSLPGEYILAYKITIASGVTQNFSLSLRFKPSNTEELGKVIQVSIIINPGETKNYDVNLVLNKGYNTTNTFSSVEYNNNVTIPFSTLGFDPSGVVLKGSGCSFGENNSSIIVNNVKKDMTCTVSGFIPLPYRINYNCNGHFGAMVSTTALGNATSITLSPNICENQITIGATGGASEFIGWARTASATQKEFSDQEIINVSSMPDNRVLNLFAVWKNTFSVNGNYYVNDEENGNWKIKIYGATGSNYGNAQITFTEDTEIDLFLIGAGGGAGTGAGDAYGGNGGAGYSQMFTETIEAGTYTVTVGEGVINTDGNPTSAFNHSVSGGGRGANGYYTNDIWDGAHWIQSAHQGATGAGGDPVYEFNGTEGILYCYAASNGIEAQNNSGVGGGGYYGNYNTGSKSGSGIIIIRNHRETS